MTRSTKAVALVALVAATAGCARKAGAPPSDAAAEPAAASVPVAWFGEYADDSYPKGWWRKLTLAPGATPTEVQVDFTSTSTRPAGDEPDCSYHGTGTWVRGRIETPLEWVAGDGVAVVMTIEVAENGRAVVSATGGSDPVLGLGWYCRGGASLAGEYPRAP